MRFNVRRLVAGANMVRHGVKGLARSAIRTVNRATNAVSSAPEKPAPTVKPGSPFGDKPKNLKKITKQKQKSSKMRVRQVAGVSKQTKQEKLATGANRLAAWRSKRGM